jgi:hypothetical protein
VIIYSVSALGLQFADSLWPRGHPFFAVWFFYFLGQWAVQRRQSAFALALLTWSVGMYYFLELAPLFVAFPIAFITKRPRVSLTPVLGALILSGLLWLPFLRFESYRGYRDLTGLMSPTVTLPLTMASRHPFLDARSGRPPAPEGSSEGRGTALGIFAHNATNLTDVAMSRGVASFVGGFDSVVPVAGGALFAIFVLGLCLAMPQIGSGRIRGYSRAALFLLLSAASLGCFTAGLLMRVFLHHPILPEAESHLSSLGQSLLGVMFVLILRSTFRSSFAGSNLESAGHRDVTFFAVCFTASWVLALLLATFATKGGGRRLWCMADPGRVHRLVFEFA